MVSLWLAHALHTASKRRTKDEPTLVGPSVPSPPNIFSRQVRISVLSSMICSPVLLWWSTNAASFGATPYLPGLSETHALRQYSRVSFQRLVDHTAQWEGIYHAISLRYILQSSSCTSACINVTSCFYIYEGHCITCSNLFWLAWQLLFLKRCAKWRTPHTTLHTTSPTRWFDVQFGVLQALEGCIQNDEKLLFSFPGVVPLSVTAAVQEYLLLFSNSLQ